VFVGAVLSKAWTVRPKRVAVMLDVSESMSAVKAESAAAAAAEGFALPTGAAEQEWAFGDTAVRVEAKGQKPKAKSQIGGRTRIGAALHTVGTTRPGAVVLLSDGQDNGGTDAVAAARAIGVPVYTVGFGGLAKRNLSTERVMLPAVVYSGDTVEVQVRVAAAGFAEEKTRVRLRGDSKEIVLGQAMAEQDVPFRLVFDKPGRQVIEARADSMMEESNYADNVRSVVVDVRPGRVRVAYVTNRPGPDTRMMMRALASDERIEVEPVVAVVGTPGFGDSPRAGTVPVDRVDVFILDNVVETGNPDAWQSIAARVEAGAGAMVLAGPDFQPGPNIGKLLNGAVGRAQAGSFTPDLTDEGRLLPWFGNGVVDLGTVPPFVGARPLSVSGGTPTVWLVAQENRVPLLVAEKYGRGRVVYSAAYPLWRWGFGPEEKPDLGTSLSNFVTGVVRYLAERDTSPFWLQAEKQELYRGQPVRLVMRAVAPDGRPWTGLSVMLGVVRADSGDSPTDSGDSPRAVTVPLGTVSIPMTETGEGVYEATLEALGPGRHRAVATVSLTDTVLGRAATEFAVAEQALELANTGMNEGLLRAISEASGGRFFASESLPRDGTEITLGSYQRRLAFDPRHAVWAYVLVALLAGAEWFLRRRKGLL
ncbi:MAG: hypothetical protein NTX53_03655, partial [candidate division WOR-3 bacterium]|nr:hypothetical protein [candidate division WOR-3 bacterium]